MSHLGDTVVFQKPTGSIEEGIYQAGLVSYLAPDPPRPEHFINVRLTNGTAYYNAGGTTISGGAALSADQGAPNLLSAAWPVKVTDGTSLFGTEILPQVVKISTGSLGNYSTPLWITGSVFVLNPSSGSGAGGTVTGSVKLTEAVSVSGIVSVTGTVALARAVDIASMPSVTVANPVTSVSITGTPTITGSVSIWGVSAVTGTVALARGVDIASMPSVTVANPVTSVTTLTGSVVAILNAGNPVAASNPLPITGSVSIWGTSAVTGTVALARAVDIASMPVVTVNAHSVTQGTAAALSAPWPVIMVSGSDPVGTVTHPMWVTGSVYVLNQGPGGGPSENVTTLSGSIVALQVAGTEVTALNPIPITGSVVLARGATITGSVSIWGVSEVTGSVSIWGTSAVTGTVALARAVDIASMPSVTVSNTVQVTGALKITEAVTVANPVTSVSVSALPAVTGNVALTEPVVVRDTVSITGSVSLAERAVVTGTVALARGVDIASMPVVTVNAHSVTQGTAAALSAPWPVIMVSGSDPVGTETHPMWVTGSVYVLNQGPGGGPSGNVTTLSGSIVALQVAGTEVTALNPVPVTGSVVLARVATVTGSVSIWGTSAVTGTVALARAVDIASMPSVTVANPVTSVTTLTGSVVAILNAGNPVAASNPLPITGSVSIWGISAVTGTVALTRGVDIASMPSVTVANPVTSVTTLTGSVVAILNAGNPVAASNPLPITGSVTLASAPTVTVSNPVTSVSISNSPSVTALSGSLVGHLVGGVAVSEANPIPTRTQRASTPTVTALTASVTSQLLKPTNSSRLGMTIYNDSVANAYIKFGGPVSTNDFSTKLFPDDYYEVPYGYTGRVDILWTAATGSARVTEFV